MNLCDHVTLFKPQESLANGKVSARQQRVYEGPLAKKSVRNGAKNIMLKSTFSGSLTLSLSSFV